MESFENAPIPQGDIMFAQLDTLPDGLTPIKPSSLGGDGVYILAKSVNGHHHYTASQGVEVFESSADPNVIYLRCALPTKVVHSRQSDAHDPVMLKAGKTYIGIRQVERSPEGWRRVED